MPTNRRRRQNVRREFNEDDVRRMLLYGRGFFIGRMDRPSIEELGEYWAAYRDDLVREWLQSNLPGTRPLGQWRFEIIPEHGERPIVDAPNGFDRRGHELLGVLHLLDSMGVQQPEHEFLFEHNLIDQTEYQAAVALCDESEEIEL